MKTILPFILSLAVLLSLTACGSTDHNSSGSTPETVIETTEAQTEAREETTAATEEIASQETEDTEETIGGKALVAYFSLAGEQYAVGVIEEGNTSIIAHMIGDAVGADLFEIQAETPYPTTHSELLDVSRQEMSENARPAYVGDVENWADYDTVYLGFPNWWGDMPMIVYHFLESHDWSGKTVIPFCTHGGSGLSGTERTIAQITGAAMMDGFAISGETAQNDRERGQAAVNDWLREGGLID